MVGCASPCISCEKDLTQRDVCQSCESGFKLQSGTCIAECADIMFQGECIQHCPVGTQRGEQQGQVTCVGCSEGCMSCANDICDKCLAGFVQ